MDDKKIIDGDNAVTVAASNTLKDVGAFSDEKLVGGTCSILSSIGGNTGNFYIRSHTDDILTLYENPGDGTAVTYQICMDEYAHQSAPAYDYESCSECTDRNDPGGQGDHPSGGGGIGGGWGGIGDDLPGGGGAGHGPEPEWKKAFVCPAHAGRENVRNVYVPSSNVTEDKWFRYAEICYYVKESSGDIDYDDLPDDAHQIAVYGTFESCNECTKGVQATLCPDQDNPGTAPDVWINVANLPDPAEQNVFRYGDYCYEIDTSDAQSVVPEGSVVLSHTTNQYTSCSHCLNGKQATLCPDEIHPGYDVWVGEGDLPESNSVIFLYNGLCYVITSGPPIMRIPNEVRLAIPPDTTQYATCEDCICGIPLDHDDGVRARACPMQAGFDIEEIWVKEADIPDELWIFRYGNVCYWIGPNLTVNPIPADALVVTPRKEYTSCFDCTNTFPDPGGPYPGPDPAPRPDPDPIPSPAPWPDPDPYPEPWPPKPEPDPHGEGRMRRWHDCDPPQSATGTYCTDGPYNGMAVRPKINIRDLVTTKCYFPGEDIYAKGSLPPDSYPGFPKYIYTNCEKCLGYKLTPCDIEAWCTSAGSLIQNVNVVFAGVTTCPDDALQCCLDEWGTINLNRESGFDLTWLGLAGGTCLWQKVETWGDWTLTVTLSIIVATGEFRISVTAVEFLVCDCGNLFTGTGKFPALDDTSTTFTNEIGACGTFPFQTCEGGTAEVTWEPTDRCPGGNAIYTSSSLAAYVGKVVELDDGVCYQVAYNETSNPTQGYVTVVEVFDSCEDCCADQYPLGYP